MTEPRSTAVKVHAPNQTHSKPQVRPKVRRGVNRTRSVAFATSGLLAVQPGGCPNLLATGDRLHLRELIRANDLTPSIEKVGSRWNGSAYDAGTPGVISGTPAKISALRWLSAENLVLFGFGTSVCKHTNGLIILRDAWPST